MINSRDLKELHPKVRAMTELFIKECDKQGIDLLVTSTYRDHESQNELYAQGRTKPGKIVTNAKGGESFHNFRVAIDVVPVVNGKAVWTTTGPSGALWKKLAQIGKACGFEWAGEWKTFKEMAHFQYTAGLTLKDFQAGKHLPK